MCILYIYIRYLSCYIVRDATLLSVGAVVAY